MANRKVFISGLHGGERFGISIWDKIPLYRLVGKVQMQHQEDARPGEANLGNIQTKIPIMGM